MKKKIIIEEKRDKSKLYLYRLTNWLIHMVAYSLILIAVSVMFKKTIYIDNSYFGFYSLLASIIIYILNKTIKPIIVWLTLPVTGLTLGIFYPFINVFILNIVDFILGKHFMIKGLLMSFIVAIIISIMNIMMDGLIIKPFLKEGE